MNKILPTVVAFSSFQKDKLKRILTQFFQIDEDSRVLSLDGARQKRKGLSKSFALLLMMLFMVSFANATTYYTFANGAPESTANWWTATDGTGSHPANFTTAGDIFIIQNSNTMTGVANWNVTGAVTINSGCSLIFTASGKTLSMGGLTINSTGVLTCSRPLTINGATNITGTINLQTTAGNNTFSGDVTLNAGSVWNETVANTSTITGNFTNNATTFTASSGLYTFSGSGKTFSGSTTTVIPNAAITGTYTNNGILNFSTSLAGSGGTLTNASGSTLTIGGTGGTIMNITTLTNAGTMNVGGTGAISTALANFTNTSTGTLNLNGSGTITGITNNGTVNLANSGLIGTFNNVTGASVLQITATTPNITTLNATTTGNIVNYNGASQTVKGTTYSNLTLSGSGTKTLGTATITNGSLTLNNNTSLAMSTFLLTLNGDLVNNGSGTVSGTTGGVTIGGTADQSLAGFTTTGTVSMAKTGGTATFLGNVNGAGLTINGTGGTLNLGTALTHTFTGNVTLSAGTLNGGSSLLNVNATSATAWNGTGTVFTAGTSTVNFGGVNQTIATATTFNNVTLSGGGTKTFGATTTINNNLSIATGVSANLGTAFTHSAGTLTLGGYGTASGYWGSTTATTATNQNNTYFSAVTGRVNVGSATCSAISATLSGSTSVCNGGSSNLVVTMVGGSGLYKVVYSNGSTNTTVNSYVSGANIPVTTSSTTTYTLVSVSDANGCTATTAGSAIVTVSSSITTSAGSYTFCIDNSNTITTAAVKEGQYVLVDVIKGFTYTFSVGNVFTGNEVLTLLDDTTNGNVTPTATVSGASGASISWSASLSGKVKVLLSSSNCANGTTGGTLTLVLNSIGNTQDDQTIAGTDTWVGHIYNAGGVTPEPFLDANYAGYYNISSETINEGFGGNTSCFAVNSNGIQRASIYTEGYAVRYQMKSTRAAGCYLITISGDDGVRLSVDGVKVFDQWQEQSVATYGNVLVYLNGNSNLILDYYENAGANQVNFTITPFDSTSNSITAPSPSTVCSGVTPGLINGSAYTYKGTTVNPTIKYQWQLSSDNVTWTNISGATSEDYTPPSTPTTGVVINYYRRVVSAAASNASACSWNSNSISIITGANIATSAPTLAAISNLTCSSFTANWNSVATATSYKLDVSTNATFSTFVSGYNNLDVGLVTSFNISGLSNTTLYYYRLRAYNGCSGSTSTNSSSNTTTVSPIATISGTTSFCQGATSPNITFTNALSNAITVIYTVNGGTNASVNIAANSTATVVVSTATSGSFVYNLVSAAYQTAPTCLSTITGSATVTVRSAFTSGAINTTGETICNGGTPVTAIGSATAASGGDTTITYSWRSSADGYASAISGATSATYLPPSGLTTTTSYQRYAKDGTCNTIPLVSTGTWTVTVRSAFTSGAINTTGETICNGGTPVTAIGSATAAGGGDATITYSWKSSADGYTAAISGATSASYLPPSGLTTTTSYRRYAKDGTCNTTAMVSTGTWTVTVRSAFTSGAINTTGEIICNGRTPVTTIGSATAAGGGDATITYSWRSSADSYTSAISGATSATYLPPPGLTTITSYRRYAKDGTCNTTATASTGTWTVTVNPNLPASVSIAASATTICSGTSVTFTATPTNGGTTPTYQWIVNGGNVGTNSSSYTNSTFVNGDVVTCVMTSNATPCLTGSPTTSNAITMNVSSSLPIPAGISVNGSAPGSTHTYCASTSAVLSIAAVANATSYFWDLPSDWTLVSGQGTTSVTVITGHAPTSNVSVFANNICGYSGASSLAIALSTIPPTTPTVTLIQTDCSNPTGGITVTKPAPSSGIIYTVTGTNPVVSAISNSTGVFTGLSVGDYTVTYQNGAGCVSSNKSVSIGATNTNTWDGTKWSKTGDTTPPTSGDVVVFNGNYSLNTDIEGCSCQVNSGFTVTIASGKTMTITNGVSNGGTLIFEDRASLVQYNDAAINTGKITYKRISSPMKNFDFTYWSSPVQDQILNVLSPNTFYDKYFSYANSAWLTENGANMMNPAGKGFIIRVPKPNATYPNGEYWTGTTYSQPVHFEGVPYNGKITIPAQAVGQFNLLGNPYPSAIDADLFMIDANNKSVITGALYFWTHSTASLASGNQFVYNSNDYATYNLTGGTAAATGGGKPLGNIGACQSFFVSSKAVGNFEFTNSMRIFGANNKFFKMSNTKKTTIVEKNRVWLNLTNSGGAFKQLLVGYITGASNDLDNLYDGVSINGNTYVDFYSVNTDKNLTIQGRALPFNQLDEVPLGYKTSIEGSFDISIDNVDGVLANQAVYLEDKVTNVLHNLKDGAYTFTTLKGEFKERFVLRYTDGAKLGTPDFNAQGKSVIVSVKNHQIKINSFQETIASVMVYDLKGSLLYENKKVDKNEFIIQNLTSSDQFLIVLTQLTTGDKVSKEVIFQN